MALEYDSEANALYMKVKDNDKSKKIKKTVSLGNGVFVDVDAKDKPIGIEVILPKKKTSADITRILDYIAKETGFYTIRRGERLSNSSRVMARKPLTV